MNDIVSRFGQIKENFYKHMQTNKRRLIRLEETKVVREEEKEKRASATNTNSNAIKRTQ